MAYARRVDGGSQSLVQAARDLGFTVIPLRGAIDAILVRAGKVHLVDWKRSAKAPKTAKQQALVEQGVPVQFIYSVDQLLAMVQT